MQPIYGTTESGTLDILDKWLNNKKDLAIKMLILHISVNKPDTPNNNELMARETIEKYIEDNF